MTKPLLEEVYISSDGVVKTSSSPTTTEGTSPLGGRRKSLADALPPLPPISLPELTQHGITFLCAAAVPTIAFLMTWHAGFGPGSHPARPA